MNLCFPYITILSDQTALAFSPCYIYACPNTRIVANGCNKYCSGDQFFMMFDQSGALVALSDDSSATDDAVTNYCNGICSKIDFTPTDEAGCQYYTLKQGCYGDDSCGGATTLTITDLTTSPNTVVVSTQPLDNVTINSGQAMYMYTDSKFNVPRNNYQMPYGVQINFNAFGSIIGTDMFGYQCVPCYWSDSTVLVITSAGYSVYGSPYGAPLRTNFSGAIDGPYGCGVGDPNQWVMFGALTLSDASYRFPGSSFPSGVCFWPCITVGAWGQSSDIFLSAAAKTLGSESFKDKRRVLVL